MAKCVRNAAFRKIDVDQYNEENYEEELIADDIISGPNISEIQSLIANSIERGKNADALALVLSSPPVNTKNQATKDKASELVMKIMTSFKLSEIDGALSNLDQTKLEVLMKYIYKGFEKPSENCSAQFLVWYDRVYAKTGIGCIVRVLTDRKRI